ncbi:ATP-dependent DNA helicase PIF1-like [Menidia menidia]
MRAVLSAVEILIINEISIVSKELFAYIHWRFQQIRGNKKPFGGISVLAVGDFYQLPPLGRAKPLCVFEEGDLDLWKDNFHMVDLTEIMRQKDDRTFAELLNRIRVKQRDESLTKQDMSLLSRAVCDPHDCPVGVFHIFATNKQVDSYNSATVAAHCPDAIDIKAEDYKKCPRAGVMISAGSLKGKKRDLPDNIQAATGVRVMIIRNLDVEDGMVNGTFGTIAHLVIEESVFPNSVKLIGLRLDHPIAGQRFRKKILGPSDDLVYVERSEESMSFNRRQFPMKLAFACTAHKVKGMTMQAAVVSLERIFEPGMAYVALSRTTSLEGLYITHFNDEKIYGDQKSSSTKDT